MPTTQVQITLEQETAKFVKSLDKPDAKPIYKMEIEDARKLLVDVQSGKKEMAPVDIEEKTLPVGPSGKVSVTIIRPKGETKALPAVMFNHGAGWILGEFTTHERLVRQIVAGVHATVVFVNFSRSPEAKFPTAIEEAYAAARYVAENPKEFNVIPGKLAVCGDSVGGNMTIAVTLLAKQRGGPKFLKQILFYPVTDANFENGSYKQFADGPWLTKPAMEWFWDAYADEKTRKDILVTPNNATKEDLEGLPPALIMTAEFDVLRDEGESYAHKLMEAGVHVTAMRLLGTIHDFVMLDALGNTPAAQCAVAAANAVLREALA